MAGLNGKWKLVSVDNFDAYQQAIGVNDENRAKGNALFGSTGSNAVVEELEFTASTGKRTLHAQGQSIGGREFPLNTEFDAPTLDGRTSKVKVVAESANKIVRTDVFENGVQGTMTSELVGNQLKSTMVAGGVTSTRFAERV